MKPPSNRTRVCVADTVMSDADRVPLVAIATPVYNGAEYLADTMACVQAQTYPNLVHCVLDNARYLTLHPRSLLASRAVEFP